jgi:hypothetical protein
MTLDLYESMKRFHLIFGLLVIVIFLLTGQYMDKFLQHLEGMPDGPRMLYRTRHIFILLSGLLNVGIGTYFSYGVTRWRRVLQFLGSGLIVVATALFVVGFFTEPKLSGLATPGPIRACISSPTERCSTSSAAWEIPNAPRHVTSCPTYFQP